MSDDKKYSYSDFIDQIILAIEAGDEDDEMQWKSDLKTNFRQTDEQINAALFKTFSKSKITKITPENLWVDLSQVEPLSYLMDGWLLKGDVCLTYGSYGAGKTTFALWKAYHYAQGKNILDRETPCEAGRTLFICTDGGVNTFKKAMDDLGISEDDPVMQGEKQMIFVWGYDPVQGHDAWSCNINGVIKLENFIQEKEITNIVIDSAKSVSSRAGWSYTDNQSVRALLQYVREGIAQPKKCNIEFLSHDGTEKGAHAGAKSWAEEPSMVLQLAPIFEEDEQSGKKKQIGVKAQFKKDRAAFSNPRRTVRFNLVEGEMVLLENEEVVGNCETLIKNILWDSYQLGIKELTRKEIQDKAYKRNKAKYKTVDNTLGTMANQRKIVRPHRGKYSLSKGSIQELEAGASLHTTGSEISKSIAGQGLTQLPDGFTQGTSGTSHDYLGKKVGKLVNPSCDNESDLFSSFEMETTPEIMLQGSGFDIGDVDGDDPEWGPRK